MDLPVAVAGDLDSWLDNFETAQKEPLSAGYQASTWLFEHPEITLVVKVAPNTGLRKYLLGLTLKHEYQVYKKLQGVAGVPKCYGLYKDRFLVLEYIQGQTLREREPADHDYFYLRLLQLIKEIHKRGVMHVDLKRKDNILVVNHREPYLIDFGVAVIVRQWYRPLNRFLLNLGKRYDYNAWVKHKYNRRYDLASPEDQKYLQHTFSERVARFFKQNTKKLLRSIRSK